MDQETTKENGPQGQDAEAAPESPEQPKKEYEIDIFRDWCKGCGICAGFCPKNCIRMDEDGNPVIVNRESCTGCRWCELHCPDFAICIKELVKKEVTAGEAD